MAKQSGFQFKQFFIEHTDSAMKVTTDSIALGSWAEASSATRILDIGTGSGILAIMLAQKTPANADILGIDISTKAIAQAQKNALASPWSDKLRFTRIALQAYVDEALTDNQRKFDLIISNPPYFEGKAGTIEQSDPHYIVPQRRDARHTVSLSHRTLLSEVSRLLTPEGTFYCVLPSDVSDDFVALAENENLFCLKRLDMCPRPTRKPKLSLLCFSSEQVATKLDSMIIRDESDQYTSAYRTLCCDYYLNF